MPLNKVPVEGTLRFSDHRFRETVIPYGFHPQVENKKLIGKLLYSLPGYQDDTHPLIPLFHFAAILYCSNLVHVPRDLGEEYIKKNPY